MASGRVRRLNPNELQAMRAAVIGVRALPDYQPRNPANGPGALEDLVAAMDRAREAEVRASQDLATARLAAQHAEWALHERLLGVKDEVRAQYGADSHAMQLVGLKRKSERRRASRRAPAQA
jgi:hypothetical protein